MVPDKKRRHSIKTLQLLFVFSAASFFTLSGCSKQSESTFQCPSLVFEDAHSQETISPKNFDEMRAILGAFPRQNAILEARAFLKQKNPNISNAKAVDYIAAAYCTTFYDDASLSDTAKTDRMRRWNRIITTAILNNSQGSEK